MRIVRILLPLLLLAACTPDLSQPAAPDGTGQTLPETRAATAPAATQQWVSGPLVFTLTAPDDGAVVNHPQVALEGTTSIETILSINDEIFLLPAGQSFSLPIALEEGPNALSVVASDYEGHKIEFVLIVIYQPEEVPQ